MINRSFSLLLLPFLFFISSAFAAPADVQFKEKNTLSVCSYTAFKPVSYGNGLGYEADILRAVATLWDVKIKFYPERIYEGIWLAPSKSNANCDIAAGGITPDNYRVKAGAVFSDSTLFFNQSLLVKKRDYESGRIVSYGSFKNTDMKIGVVPGTTGELYGHERAKAAGLPLSVFVTYESEADLLPALIGGKIQAIARGEIGNAYQAEQDKSLVTIARQDFKDSFAFSVTNTNKPLLVHLNEAIHTLTDNGKISYHEWIKNPNVFMERAKASK